MTSLQNESAAAAIEAAVHELDRAVNTITHCVEQLNDEQVWWRPSASMNSIANLMLHVAGNMRQWIIAGVGHIDDTRNRPQEFAERGPIGKDELVRRLRDTAAEAVVTLTNANPDDLLVRRKIQSFDVTGFGAMFHSVAHLCGHTQEIVHMSRCQLGDRYEFAFVPKTREQGAP